MTLFNEKKVTTLIDNPHIRIKRPGAPTGDKEEYINVPLLEYHPDYDTRLKFRGRAYIPYSQELTGHSMYTVIGMDYLAEPYIDVREIFIHPDDNDALRRYCRSQLNHAPLIVKPVPRGFPMFEKGNRVIVVKTDIDSRYTFPGELATCTEDSSPGGMSTIRYDKTELNNKFYAVGAPSICLRLAPGELQQSGQEESQERPASQEGNNG